MSDDEVLQFLRKLGFAKDLTGTKCGKCKVGVYGPEQSRANGRHPVHKCTKKSCRCRAMPWSQCPLLHTGRRSATPREQLMNLLSLSATNSVAATAQLTGHSEKSVARTRSLLQLARKVYVQRIEKTMVFGSSKQLPPSRWPDIEVDEASFGKMILRPPRHPGDKVQVWENWIGMVRRGHPNTLLLVRSTNGPTLARSPGPGPITKEQWRAISSIYFKNRHVVLHSDSARAYREVNIPGAVRDQVVHKKRRVYNSKKKKYIWLKPKYVKTVKHKIGGKTIWRKAGTQSIDSCWKFLKSRLKVNQELKPGTKAFAAAVRSAQYEYWTRGQDPWTALLVCRASTAARATQKTGFHLRADAAVQSSEQVRLLFRISSRPCTFASRLENNRARASVMFEPIKRLLLPRSAIHSCYVLLADYIQG
eukprot:3830111-Pyramimonas_sp.AAC.1